MVFELYFCAFAVHCPFVKMYLCRTKGTKNNRLTAQVNCAYSCFLVTLTMVNVPKDST